LLPQLGDGDVLVVVTVNGPQPPVTSVVKEAIGAGLTQIVLVISSLPQFVLPIFNLMV
jgi:UTP-glucose-1-phosphate uridylyltransferase